MQVILLEQVRKLGKVGDVVNVKNGYGRNFLIPNKKALRATKANIDLFEVKKKDIVAANQGRISEAETAKSKVEGAIVPVILQAAEDGRLYGSVNATAIATSATKKIGQTVDKKQIVLNIPIKYIGVHDVEVELYADVTATIHVNVSRSESEAADAEERFKKGDRVMEGPGAVEARKARLAAEAEEAAKEAESRRAAKKAAADASESTEGNEPEQSGDEQESEEQAA